MPPAVFEQVGGKWHLDLFRLTLVNPANKSQIRQSIIFFRNKYFTLIYQNQSQI